MIPLIIKYPGCPKNIKIADVVSSLDIATTILSLLKIPYKKYGLEGLNLLKLISGEKTSQRKIRTDTRYYFQQNKITSLRGNRYKYTYYFEKPRGLNEGFFDIENDRLEQKNLINSTNKEITNKLNEFRKEFNLSERKGLELQQKYLGQKFKNLLNNVEIKKANKVLVFGTSNVIFVNILLNNIINLLKNVSVDVIIKRNPAKELKINSKKINFIFSNLTYKDFKKRLNKIRRNKYDLIVIPLNNPLCIGYNQIFKIASRIKADKVIKVDYNMGLIEESNMWPAILKDLKKNLITDLFNLRTFAGNLLLLAKRIIFEKNF